MWYAVRNKLLDTFTFKGWRIEQSTVKKMKQSRDWSLRHRLKVKVSSKSIRTASRSFLLNMCLPVGSNIRCNVKHKVKGASSIAKTWRKSNPKSTRYTTITLGVRHDTPIIKSNTKSNSLYTVPVTQNQTIDGKYSNATGWLENPFLFHLATSPALFWNNFLH